MPSIFIFGHTGYFGSHFARFFREKGWKVAGERVDVRDFTTVRDILKKHGPDVVLNCAGKTGTPNIDWCETHVSETVEVNVAGALNIACACADLGLYMAHMGSGCVYSGNNGGRGFTEDDEPNFYGSLYSRTKIHSEKLLKEFGALQLRVRIPIEGKPHPKNVIDKLLRYEKIISTENSFTVMEDFLPAAVALMERRERGIFNMTNVGSMDHRFLMDEYRRIVDAGKELHYMSLEELESKVLAPRSNCVLDTAKREVLGIRMPAIQKRIPAILESYKNNR